MKPISPLTISPQITDYRRVAINSEYDSCCAMLNFPYISEIEKFQESIDIEDVYMPDTEKYGIERNHHVTILYGMLPTVLLPRIVGYLCPLDNISITATGLSFFDCPDFDVLKMGVVSQQLTDMNAALRANIPYKNDYPDYVPHITLAYLRKGTAVKYVNRGLIAVETIHPKEYVYSTPISKEFFKL